MLKPFRLAAERRGAVPRCARSLSLAFLSAWADPGLITPWPGNGEPEPDAETIARIVQRMRQTQPNADQAQPWPSLDLGGEAPDLSAEERATLEKALGVGTAEAEGSVGWQDGVLLARLTHPDLRIPGTLEMGIVDGVRLALCLELKADIPKELIQPISIEPQLGFDALFRLVPDDEIGDETFDDAFTLYFNIDDRRVIKNIRKHLTRVAGFNPGSAAAAHGS